MGSVEVLDHLLHAHAVAVAEEIPPDDGFLRPRDPGKADGGDKGSLQQSTHGHVVSTLSWWRGLPRPLCKRIAFPDSINR
jgi:hypothetical protein